ncbi:unnamed protein product [Prorocentrum cordatum]|uniref:Origin recognition complex subunit 3 N-terminal domain-containing protein n=1 Tax=Prorocentrum cordatum TaxID=2364126 RepID=A0ABN9T403_9DINO|nr:unnamed protein product [Polarella glacialis]
MAASAAAASATFVSRPWRLQTAGSTPTPADAQQQQQGTRQPEPPSWRCSVVRRLEGSLSPDTAFGQAFAHWARKAEALATNHVRTAFERGCAGLAARAEGVAAGAVSATIALAGTDVADHEATMRLAARLLAASAPAARIALVGPGDFRSFALATRCICAQLSGEGSGAADVGDDDDGEDDDAPHCSDQKVRRLSTPARFARWLSRSGSAAAVVILVEQADSLPKEMLRGVLSTWGSACGDHGIPISCLLGLQHSPTGLHRLLGGDCAIPVINTSAVTLFNAQEVCYEFLCLVAEDEEAPLPLFPETLMWLRDHFLNSRRSMSRVLKALALLCDEHASQNQLSAICISAMVATNAAGQGDVPRRKCVELVGSAAAAAAASLAPEPPEVAPAAAPGPSSENAYSWTQALAERLRGSQELVGCLRDAGFAGRLEGPADEERLLNDVAEAAAAALEWRTRLCRSLEVWDILLCTLQPTARHEVQVRRMWRLLSAVWPRQTAASSGADGSADQDGSGIDKLVGICLQKLDRRARTIDAGELRRMLELLLPASASLDEPLQVELRALVSSEHGEDELCSGVQSWVQAAEAEVLALARGPMRRQRDDASLVCRLLESVPGRTVELAELFAEFSRHAGDAPGPAGGDAAEQSRFGRALMQLHMQGLHAPVRSGGQHRKQKRAFAGWRTRKRAFGRVWVKAAQQTRITQFFGKAPEVDVVEKTVSDRTADRSDKPQQFVSPIFVDPRDAKKVVDAKEAPWAMAALRKGPATRLQTALREKLGASTAAVELHPAKRQRRTKIFMA